MYPAKLLCSSLKVAAVDTVISPEVEIVGGVVTWMVGGELDKVKLSTLEAPPLT
jgi:hypothetical protein